MQIIIPLLCRSKKNSEEIIVNPKTNKPMIIQSKYYRQFEKDCGYFLKRYAKHIDYPINLKCTFIVPNKRKRDLTNLENSIADILIKYGVIEDDNSEIVAGWDGSRVIYEKGKEETIIEIERIEEKTWNTKD